MDPEGSKKGTQQAFLDFRRADGVFRDLLGRLLWYKALKGRGAEKKWLIFKDHLL